MQDLIFFDIETTGLNKDKHTIIEIAIVKTNWRGDLINEWHTKIKPTKKDLDRASPKALEINHFSVDEWEEAPLLSEVSQQIETRLQGGLLVGQNIGMFDIPFVQAVLERERDGVRISRRYLDTMSLAIEHLMPCGLKSVSLKNIRKALNIDTGKAHTALADTLACVEVYKKLSRSTWLQRLYWKVTIPNRMKEG